MLLFTIGNKKIKKKNFKCYETFNIKNEKFMIFLLGSKLKLLSFKFKTATIIKLLLLYFN